MSVVIANEKWKCAYYVSLYVYLLFELFNIDMYCLYNLKNSQDKSLSSSYPEILVFKKISPSCKYNPKPWYNIFELLSQVSS